MEVRQRNAEPRLYLLHRLPKCNPESVEVTDDELTHAVERVVNILYDFHPILQSPAQLVNLSGREPLMLAKERLSRSSPIIGLCEQQLL